MQRNRVNLNRMTLSIALASVCWPAITRAELYRCPTSDGSVVFTDRACINGERRIDDGWVNVQEEARRKREAEEAKAQSRPYSPQPQTTRSATMSQTSRTGCDNSEYLQTTPEEYRWSNDNPPGTACYRAVQKVRELDNNPNFDCDASIRQRWSQAVDYARRLGCTL